MASIRYLSLCVVPNVENPLFTRFFTQIGLFSAIVTSFLIEAVGNLKPDPADKTNALLANLTKIIVFVGRINVSEPLQLIEPERFEPEPEDIRLNIYCFVSLIFAVSLLLHLKASAHFLGTNVALHCCVDRGGSQLLDKA